MTALEALCSILIAGLALSQAPDRPAKAVVPEAATEGPRDLALVAQVFRPFIIGQPYGKTYKELSKTEPAPKDRTGLGDAKTHEALKHDPIEVQAQHQFLEETGVEARYGFASIRGVRVFRYGKLASVQLVVDMIGRTEHEKFAADVAAIAAAWKGNVATVDSKSGFKMTKNDLLDPKKRSSASVSPPLRIELSPGGSRR